MVLCAVLQARTPLMGLFDVDMLVSTALISELQSAATAAELSGSEVLAAALHLVPPKVALVLAAFELNSTHGSPEVSLRAAECDQAALYSKPEMVEAYLSTVSGEQIILSQPLTLSGMLAHISIDIHWVG